ncbi:MAG: hypothetical protein ABI628_01705 [Chloroflexota bacterium]
MRPKTIVAGVVLTTALALVAAPGFAGSRTPAPYEPVPAVAFQALKSSANARSTASIPRFDPAYDSAGRLAADAVFSEPGEGSVAEVAVLNRDVSQPDPGAAKVYKKAKYTLTGKATFYDNGTTAMRLPRGTVIRVCGAGGCLERVITDYGPVAGTNRIIDLYRPDFFKICGCGSWSGVTNVKVYVYGVP